MDDRKVCDQGLHDHKRMTESKAGRESSKPVTASKKSNNQDVDKVINFGDNPISLLPETAASANSAKLFNNKQPISVGVMRRVLGVERHRVLRTLNAH